tara:strand:- start:1123 stop:1503 length:381 start_codon:yes stop_codon:yes gene_type:complete
MSETTNPNLKLIAIRGATTAKGNTDSFIKEVVIELIQELIARNQLKEENIISITFTVTRDLNSCFPASIARKYFNFDSIAFLDCQQMFVPNDVNFCIRLLALVYLESDRQPVHPYLNESSKLRPDR